MKKRKNIFSRLLSALLILALVGGIGILVLNGIVIGSTNNRVLSPEDAAKLENVDCILVLGCAVKPDGQPSHMLEDRLKRGVALYKAGAAPKLLMSGDHGQVNYDEVSVMKQYAVDAGICAEDIFMDHAGFSTYESVYRAKEIFEANKIIIVTQKYHLFRALYIAKQFGLDAYGVDADYRTYSGQIVRDLREILARIKDWANCIVKPEPTYLGDAIPIWGSGNLTNDENANFS